MENCLSNFNKRKLEKLELRNLNSMRLSNRIIPPPESCCKEAGAAGAPRSRVPVAARGARAPAGCETTKVWGEAQPADSDSNSNGNSNGNSKSNGNSNSNSDSNMPAAASAISAARTLTSCTESVLAIA